MDKGLQQPANLLYAEEAFADGASFGNDELARRITLKESLFNCLIKNSLDPSSELLSRAE